MRRAITVFTVLALAVLMLAPSALAGTPTITRSEFIDETWIERKTCDFPVRQHATGIVVDIEWQSDDGTVRVIEVYPQDRREITNLKTGESYSYANGGPMPRFFGYPDGSFTMAGSGSWTWPFDPRVETIEPGLYRSIGHWVWFQDAEGNMTYWSIVGEVIDICQRLTP